jgi:GrpB-like predicted nucleotidyltransferase (UPF0157 family)
MIGLERGIVRLALYNAEWARLFEKERARLQAAVGDYVLDIQHVGSTSIPGMVAKPIVDIAIAVASFEAAFVCVDPIERIGYEYEGENCGGQQDIKDWMSRFSEGFPADEDWKNNPATRLFWRPPRRTLNRPANRRPPLTGAVESPRSGVAL